MSHRHLAITLLFALSASGGIRVANAQSQDDIIKCGDYNDGAISCVVKTDELTVSDISMNRGNCPDVTLDANTLALLNDDLYRRVDEAYKRRDVWDLVMYGTDGLTTKPEIITSALVEHGDISESEAEALVRRQLNPAGTYRFGDRFTMYPLARCPNLIEIQFITDKGRVAYTR